MSVILSRADVSDHSAILRLMDEARGEHLSQAQRAQQGFVQGQMDESWRGFKQGRVFLLPGMV